MCPPGLPPEGIHDTAALSPTTVQPSLLELNVFWIAAP
jgi:hypothetical protein